MQHVIQEMLLNGNYLIHALQVNIFTRSVNFSGFWTMACWVKFGFRFTKFIRTPISKVKSMMLVSNMALHEINAFFQLHGVAERGTAFTS